jgi:hypothetical protein
VRVPAARRGQPSHAEISVRLDPALAQQPGLHSGVIKFDDLAAIHPPERSRPGQRRQHHNSTPGGQSPGLGGRHARPRAQSEPTRLRPTGPALPPLRRDDHGNPIGLVRECPSNVEHPSPTVECSFEVITPVPSRRGGVGTQQNCRALCRTQASARMVERNTVSLENRKGPLGPSGVQMPPPPLAVLGEIASPRP